MMQKYKSIVPLVFICFVIVTPASSLSFLFFSICWSFYSSISFETWANINGYSPMTFLCIFWACWIMIWARLVTPSFIDDLTEWSLFHNSFFTLLISLQAYILLVSISEIYSWYFCCSDWSPSVFWTKFASSGPLMMTSATSCGVLTSLTDIFGLNLFWIISAMDKLSIS